MGIPILNKRMIYWNIAVDGDTEWTKVMQDVVSLITVEYEVGHPPRATINIISESYIEDVFYIGTKVDIWMGFDPIFLVHMMSGKVMNLPKGDAKDMMAYTLVVEGGSPTLLTIEKNRIFNKAVDTKFTIINQIAAENNLLADVALMDITPFDKGSFPMQRSKTDYEFLVDCAAKWGCVLWFSDDELTGLKTLHFYDQTTAYAAGNLQKKPNYEDTSPTYLLGYRSFSAFNNVQMVKWAFDSKRSGSPGSVSLGEFGETELPDDWVIGYRGQRWELKGKYLAQAKSNPKMWGLYLRNTIINGVSDLETTVHKYFRRIPVKDNQKDSYNNEPIKLTVDLNVGDPYLRPPRSATLISGSPDPKAVSSDLPGFLYEGEDELIAIFRMKKVTTTLDAGKLNTQIELTRNITGGL